MGGVLAFLIQLFVRVPNLYGGGVAKVEEKAEEVADLLLKKFNKKSLLAHSIGNVVPLDQVPDQVFASGAMGKGIAIDPTDGVVGRTN